MTDKLLAILALLTWTHIAQANDSSDGVTYQYDGAGNIKQIGTDRHVYDWAGRLVQSDTNGIRRTFEYDAYGNRTKCEQVGGTDCTYSGPINPATNRLQNANYDDAGNVTQFDGRTYAYDAFNMQTRETQGSRIVAEYIYTADDERIAVYVKDTGTWRWSLRDASGKVLREMTSRDPAPGAGAPGTASWNWVKDYVYRDGLLLASRQIEPGAATPSTYHYHLDHLGTPRRITDDSGRIVGAHSYHAFGPELIDGRKDEPSIIRLKYTGHERDGELDYMHARYYAPKWGRFLSVDPAMAVQRNLHSPQGWNRYAYARNNPLLRVDPDGRKDKVFVVAALEAKYTMPMQKMLNAELKETPYAGRVEVIGPSASRGQMLATLRNADSSDIVIIAGHAGRSPDAARGGNVGTLFNGQTQITSGVTMAQWANDGSAPKAVIVAGCCSNQVAQTITNVAGSETLGTNQRTINGENQPGAVAAAGVLAHGGTIQDAAAAANQHIKTDGDCGRNTGCDPKEPARFEANPPR